jgi:tetratricopeptide (TPR) repeat protein
MDGVIAAADDLVTKFADTEFKEIAFLLAAQAAKQKNDSAKAQVYGERVLQINPKSFQAQVLLGELIVRETRETDLDKEEKLGKAEKYFKDSVTAVKTSPKPNPQITDEQWADAQQQVEGEAHNGLGMAALVRKKYDVAIAEFKSASEIDPKEPAYQARLASALLSGGKNAEAIVVADKLLAMPDVHPQIKTLATQIKNQASAAAKK